MGLFTPKWKTNDRSKQIKAVEVVRKVTNEKELRRIALEAPLPDVRMAAVYQMKNLAQLREMAFSGDKYVSWAAIDSITDQNTLKEIACGNVVHAGRVVEKISNRYLLTEIVEKAVSQEAKDKAGMQLDFLNMLYETVETSCIDINQKVRHWTMKELLEDFDFTDDTHAGKVVPAIISQMTDAGMIDKLAEACKLWRNSKDAVAESARLRKLELQFNGLDKDEFLVFRCRKCGKTVRREYMCVGGLPYIVDRFVSTNDMNVVYQEQQDILDEYRDDFGKHLDENENEETDLTLLARINRVFDSIPAQLAKENKKFTYSMLEKKGRSENYQAAIQWLYDAGMINICYNLSNLSLPLEGNKLDNIFKIYMQDTGLFTAMLERGTAAKILSGELGMYKGAIYENIIADCFSKLDRKLYYFHKDSGLEIDFITTYEDEISLVEVKATTGNAKSANTVLKNKEQYHVNHCIKLCEKNIGLEGEKLTIPYYLAFLLEQ